MLNLTPRVAFDYLVMDNPFTERPERNLLVWPEHMRWCIRLGLTDFQPLSVYLLRDALLHLLGTKQEEVNEVYLRMIPAVFHHGLTSILPSHMAVVDEWRWTVEKFGFHCHLNSKLMDDMVLDFFPTTYGQEIWVSPVIAPAGDSDSDWDLDMVE